MTLDLLELAVHAHNLEQKRGRGHLQGVVRVLSRLAPGRKDVLIEELLEVLQHGRRRFYRIRPSWDDRRLGVISFPAPRDLDRHPFKPAVSVHSGTDG
jgi:hypothetical protein